MTGTRRLSLLAALAALAGSAAAAEQATAPPAATTAETGSRLVLPLDTTNPPAGVPAAPKLQATALSLATAVRLTIQHDPRVLTGRQEVARSSGQLWEARGHFDSSLTATPSYDRSLNELSNYFKDREWGKRELLRRLGEAFAVASAGVQEQLAKNDYASPQCPEGLSFVTLSENESSDITERTALAFEDTLVVLPADLMAGQEQFFEVCSSPLDLGTNPNTTIMVVSSINSAARLGLDQEIATLGQFPRESLYLMSDITREVATKATLAVTRLGANPVDEVSSKLAFRLGYAKLLHSGLLFRTDFRYQGSERNFLGKPLDPAFGGFGLRNEFPSYLTFSFDLPLGKNRGSVSTAAPQRASEFSLLAERDTLRETVSEEVFSTVLAYVALQAAQQSLGTLAESAARQRRLIELSQQLVMGGELAAAELDRVRARAALVESQVAGARKSLVQARLTLAGAIGVSVDTIEDAPLAADSLSTAIATLPPAAALIQQAIANRRDLRAASSLQNAAEVLAKAARADLKRRFDFNFTGGLNTLYESPLLRLFPAEQDVQPYVQGVRYTSLTGLTRSLQRRWRPQFSAQIVFDLPTRNSAARGRLVQEESSFETSRVKRRDLERVMRGTVAQLAESVRRAGEVVERHREALAAYEKSLDAALARFRVGDITLFDTLVTEEDLTRQRQQLVRAQQDYLSQLARLKYETGELVTFAGADTGERVAFDAAPFVAK